MGFLFMIIGMGIAATHEPGEISKAIVSCVFFFGGVYIVMRGKGK